MQNEFEKQVQQKMEELKLVPSEPVWQKVEMQIRRKKDRRRLIFWIPLLVVLLGGGLWMRIDYSSKRISYQSETHNSQENKNHTPLNQITRTTKANQRETKEVNKTETVKHSDIPSNASLKQRSVQKLLSKSKNSFAIAEQRSNDEDISLINSETAKETSVQPEEKVPDTISEIKSLDTATLVNNENKTEITPPKTDSLSKDSSSIVKPEIKKTQGSQMEICFACECRSFGIEPFEFIQC